MPAIDSKWLPADPPSITNCTHETMQEQSAWIEDALAGDLVARHDAFLKAREAPKA